MGTRLYIATPWFGTFAGGAAVALASIARALRDKGFEVCILTTCSRSPYEDWQRSSHDAGRSTVDGFEVFRFPVDGGASPGYHRAVRMRSTGEPVDAETQEAFFSEGMNSGALVEFARNLQPSAALLAGPYFQALVPSLANALPGRVALMPALHDEPEMRWAPVERMLANARKVLFLSDEEKELAIRHHGHAVGRRLIESPVVGLGVRQPAAVRTPDALRHAEWRVRSHYHLPERYFLYCGRVEPAKGLDRLIPWYAAWARRRRAGGLATVPLAVIGAGQPSILPNTPDFQYVGYVDEAEKYGAMHGAEALINPSRYESFSYVVMESWLAGRPVAVPADCAVTSGHVRRSGGGAIFEDEGTLGEVLDTLLDDDRSAALGLAGRRYVHAHYWWPEVIERIVEALEIEP